MRVDLQFRIRENNDYKRYLRSHSNWYKYLNRDYRSFKDFEDEVRKVYKLTKADKLARTLDTIEMVEKLLAAMK